MSELSELSECCRSAVGLCCRTVVPGLKQAPAREPTGTLGLASAASTHVGFRDKSVKLFEAVISILGRLLGARAVAHVSSGELP